MRLLYTLSCVLFLRESVCSERYFWLCLSANSAGAGAALPTILPPFFPPITGGIKTSSWRLLIPNSPTYINFINNGGTRRLHPDFGGEASPGSTDIYGMPYAIVNSSSRSRPVTFQYWDESDGVD